MLRKTTITIIASALASAAVIGYAANRQENDAASLPFAKISLSHAIANHHELPDVALAWAPSTSASGS